MERLKERWWASNPKAIKCEKQDDQSDGISIQNIGGVFIVIFVGIGLACITLAFEYWWYKYRKGSKVISVQEASKDFKHEHHHRPDKEDQPDFNRTEQKNREPRFAKANLFPRARF